MSQIIESWPMNTPTTPIPVVQPKGRVLLIEDDETLAGLLARVLRTDSYHVDVVDSGEDLPPTAKLGTYDVVLTDVHLAGQLTGHEVLKKVRESNPSMPV